MFYEETKRILTKFLILDKTHIGALSVYLHIQPNVECGSNLAYLLPFCMLQTSTYSNIMQTTPHKSESLAFSTLWCTCLHGRSNTWHLLQIKPNWKLNKCSILIVCIQMFQPPAIYGKFLYPNTAIGRWYKEIKAWMSLQVLVGE